MLNSFVRLQAVDAGFDPSRILYVHVTLPSATYGNDTLVATFWNRALARVQEVPGVASAGVGACMPPDECWDMNNFDLVDRPVPAGTSQPITPFTAANADFFQTLGIPLLDGRHFTAGDTAGSANVILVSRAWVQRYSSDRPPVGRQLRDGGCDSCGTTIIGVVGDVKYQGLDQNGEGIYRSSGQANLDDANLFVRTDGRAPSAMLEPVRAVLRSIDPSLALDDAGPMEERVAGSVASRRHWTAMMGGFAFAALVLAAVGIFGMLSYLVTSRMREIGVRVALGARRREVMSMIVRRGMLSAVPGAVVGLVVALLAQELAGRVAVRRERRRSAHVRRCHAAAFSGRRRGLLASGAACRAGRSDEGAANRLRQVSMAKSIAEHWEILLQDLRYTAQVAQRLARLRARGGARHGARRWRQHRDILGRRLRTGAGRCRSRTPTSSCVFAKARAKAAAGGA